MTSVEPIANAAQMRFSIATWNMDHWKGIRRNKTHTEEAWRFISTLDADVVLLQEAAPPPQGYRALVFPSADAPARWNSGGRAAFGTAVVVFNGHPASEVATTPFPGENRTVALTQCHPNSFVAVEVAVGERLVSAVSLYGILEGPLRDSSTYAVTSVHRSLSDLTPLLNHTRDRPVILGGDLNISTQLAAPDRDAHRAVFTRMQAFGLSSCTADERCRSAPLAGCPCDEPGGCVHVQTHRHSRSERPWQNDYIFASAKHLMGGLVSCQAVSSDEAWRLSDHCPVIATFDV